MTSPRSHTFAAWLVLTFIWIVNAGGAPVHPGLFQDESALPSTQGVSEDQIKSRISEIEAMKDLDETLRSQVLDFYRQALSRLELAGQNKASAEAFKEQIASAPEKTRTILQEVEQLKAKPENGVNVELPAEKTSKALEPLLTQEQAAWTDLKNQVSDLDSRLKAEQERPAKARQQLAEAKQELEEIEKDLKAAPSTDQSPLLIEANRALLTARKLSRQAEVNMLEQEQLSYEARQQLMTALHERASLQVPRAEGRVKKVQELLSECRVAEAEQAKSEAEKAQEEALRKHPAISGMAGENVELSTELSKKVAEVEDVTRAWNEARDQLAEVEKDFENTRQQVEKVGLSRVLGEVLRNRQRKLPDMREYRRNAGQRKNRISKANFRHFAIQDKREEQEDLDAAVARIMEDSVDASITVWQRERIQKEVKELLISQEEMLKKLISVYSGLVKEHTQLEVEEKLLMDEVRKYTVYLTEKLLWTPSFKPMGWESINNITVTTVWFCSPRLWIETGKTLLAKALDSVVLTVPAVLVFILLMAFSRRLRKRLESISEKVGKVHLDSYFLTIRALVITILLAAPWPFLMFTAAWVLLGSIDAPDSAKAVGAGFRMAAVYFLSLQFLRVLCIPKGIAAVHFRWPEKVVLLLRRHFLWLMAILVPAFFIVKTLEWHHGEGDDESLGRLVFSVAMVALAVFIHRILHVPGGIPEAYLQANQNSWLARLKHIWFLGSIGLSLVLAILAVTGYYYTALQLNYRLLATILLLIGSRILYDLVLRGLIMAQRRLAYARARQRWEEAKSERASEEGDLEESEESGPVVLDEPEMDLSTISDQTQKFLRLLLGLSLIVGLWVVWADVLPALGIFEQVPLWHHTVVGLEGPELMPVTLTDLILALMFTLLTFVAAANIPGVLEIAVLQHFPMESGSRYAITTLARYLITAIGLIMAIGILGVSWSSLQWLVAALSVGLGFGLQEIVANFVSGLIILFERPVRVGDTVTVGNISGTVSRIRIRATTIIDWDRKELIVPNKQFITCEVTNWTLSDPITRIIVPVGIAYGSDTTLAYKVLEELTESNPLVLDEPKPRVHFLGFGESSLDFEIRVFIRGIGNLLNTRHELHMAIDNAFREHGIEISFPQRDIHIRTIEPPLHVEQRGGDPGKTSKSKKPASREGE